MNSWHPIESAPEGVAVNTKIDDGKGARNEQLLTQKGRLWYFPDMSMYVYYTPTHWHPIIETEQHNSTGE